MDGFKNRTPHLARQRHRTTVAPSSRFTTRSTARTQLRRRGEHKACVGICQYCMSSGPRRLVSVSATNVTPPINAPINPEASAAAESRESDLDDSFGKVDTYEGTAVVEGTPWKARRM
eukprot:m.230096 g.230096  ORF g.230096 m.230096 type:complete len:118 (+) comp26016_c2_seq7:149-502(+)